MAKLEPHLRRNEKVLWQGKPIRQAFIILYGFLPASIPSLFLLLGLAFVHYGDIDVFSDVISLVIFALAFVLMPLGTSLAIIAWSFLAYKNTEYLISDQRLITQTGAIGLDTRFVDLEKIQEVYVRIGVSDRLFGTGSNEAPMAGQAYTGVPQGSRWASVYSIYPKFAALKHPHEVQKLLQEAIREAKQAKD